MKKGKTQSFIDQHQNSLAMVRSFKEERMEHEKNNSSPQENAAEINAAQVYEIRVKGCMDQVFWTDWFGGMEISMDANQEETTLRGTLADQAELYGLLSRLRNKGLTLISIQQVQQEKEDRSGDEK